MHEPRHHFHEELREVEADLQAMGAAACRLFEEAVAALAGSLQLCQQVISGDDEVDALHRRIGDRVLSMLALQGPVASDLRLLSTVLHASFHLERVADIAVNIAKITAACAGLPRHEAVLEQLEEMGDIAQELLEAAMDSYAKRDAVLARRIAVMDEPLDRLNRGMLARVLELPRNVDLLRWAINMHLVSRLIERVGDHAVDIAEQTAYLVTGTFEEFTDASHPAVGAAG